MSKKKAGDGDGAQQFWQQYTLKKKLGAGRYSVVRLVVHKATNKEYAVKCIKDSDLDKEDKKALESEVQILNEMKHPNIMGLKEYRAETDNSGRKTHFLVSEACIGGELSDRIRDKDFYSDNEAREIIKLLLVAIKYIHDKGVVHRDLKTDNLLLASRSDDTNIKIADFGFATKLEGNSNSKLSTACGTPGYIAPEILEGRPYGKEVDIWSLGVITYIVLCGYPPFHHENHGQLFNMIKKGSYEFDSPFWDEVSEDAKDFIRKMLVLDPKERESADHLLQHKWITREDPPGIASGTEVVDGEQTNPLTTDV
jgi:calcium/calmodulin-dependent protein kinase I